MTTTFTEGPHKAGWLRSELTSYGSRTLETVISGQNLATGVVVARIVTGTAVVAVKAEGANTGNGTLVIDATTPVLYNGKLGRYRLRNIEAITNGGKFRLEDPDGIVVGDFLIAAGAGGTILINDGIKALLTDGSTDFILGDGFDIDVTVVGGKIKILTPAGTDGSQVAIGLLLDNINASAADHVGAVVIERMAEVNEATGSNAAPALASGFANTISWPVGITVAQKALATAQLLARGISIRS